MSPSDLGQLLKPFVFLDFFEADIPVLDQAPIHPHSGIGTVTVITRGDMRYDDPQAGRGRIGYGGLEWMRAGAGVWHGDELKAGESRKVQGFQLWIALTPDLEDAEPLGQFIEATDTPQVGPARVMIGAYAGARSPAQSPPGITYLLVTLAADETWTYTPPPGHETLFLGVAAGSLDAGEPVTSGELAAFEPGPQSIDVRAGPQGTTFVIGSARPHPHDLVLGQHSVHTSEAALRAGEARIRALRRR